MVSKKIISQWRIMSLAFAAVWTLSLLSAPYASAAAIQDTIVDVTDSVRINFPAGNAVLDESFADNAEAFRVLNKILYPDTGRLFVLRGVNFVGGASPEGGETVNRNLSQKRADAVYAYFKEHYKEFSSVPAAYSFVGKDWKGLLALVKADPSMPYKDETVAFLEKTASAYDVNVGNHVGDEAVTRLRQIGGGTPYLYMQDRFFPKLRGTNVYITYDLVEETEEPAPVAEPEPEPLVEAEPIVEPEPVAAPAPAERKPFYMDISTNMLYDLALTPNISVEFYLGRRWSVAADWKYAWWSKESSNFYWRNYGGDLVIRKWLGRKSKEKPLQGHHLGVYGKMFLYDYQLGGTGRISGKYTYSEYVGDNDQSWNYSAGIEYGYSLPVARRLNIDFAVGVGYAGGNTNSYEPDSGHHYSKSSKKVNYVGPTRANISLVWLLGHGNYNAGKGRRSK